MMKPVLLSITLLGIFVGLACRTGSKSTANRAPFDIIAYYSGDGKDLQRYHFEQLTQVIYSFCHLRGSSLAVDNAEDSLVIRDLVALKGKYPRLKVLLSLGGWCGCKECSPAFSTNASRQEFARSVLQLMETYHTDGLDLDWEYPAIEGCPGHSFVPADRDNFTALVAELRSVLGRKYQLSFAAGGFKDFFDHSIDWRKVMPLVDRVNLMSYDLVSGFSTRTGHHTPLYSTPEQGASLDAGVKYLISLGVPPRKIVVGAAFYGRVWEQVENTNNGLYQSGKFKDFVGYRKLDERLSADAGFVHYRDTVAQAPYAYSPARKEYATYEDPVSLKLKTQYAMDKGLGGIMFWQLTGDSDQGKLLQSIYRTAQKR